jgi:predicted permease
LDYLERNRKFPEFLRRPVTGLAQDVRFALRLLRKSPVLSAVAVASLALGIGATTAVFSLADALLLRPLPAVEAPEELVAIAGVRAKRPENLRPLSWANYLDYATSMERVSGLAASASFDLSLTQGGPAERLSGVAVSDNYFQVLGVEPALGRLFSAGEEPAPVAVLGHALWRQHFGADPGVIGSQVALNGKPVVVMGVAPEGFWGTNLSSRSEVWLPLGAYSEIAAGVPVPFSGKHDREQEWLDVVGRLAPGVSLEQARSAFAVEAERLAAAYPKDNAELGIQVVPLTELALGPGRRPRVRAYTARLLVVTLLVLAVAVINLAGLLLARALARRREIAVRLSLGSSRGRLTRQLLIEGLVLALFGGAAGAGLAKAALPLLAQIELPVSVAVREPQISGRALGFALVVSLVSCLVFALAPTLQALRTRVAPALRGEPPRGAGRRLGSREVLVSAQVALALLLLAASGLMLRTLANLASIDPGFDPGRVLVLSVDLSPTRPEGSQVAGLYHDLLDRVRHLPGVEAASMASALPVMGSDLQVQLTVDLGVGSAAPGTEPPSVFHALVGDDYFQTVGMKLLRGRSFGPGDHASAPGAVVVNQTAARRLWPGLDPLGRRLRLVQTETPFEVVGVVADAIYSNLKEEAGPVLYLAHSQAEKSFIGALLAPEMTLLVRTAGEPRQVLGAVRETVHSLDPRLPVFRASTLKELLGSTVGVERQAAALLGGLALVAAALALLGLYGALSHAVVERKKEIGVRLACGASPGRVRAMVLRRSVFLALMGMAAGLALAVPAGRFVESHLYGVEVGDPVTWIATILLLLGAALLTSASPARRAARIDPASVLRYG